MFFFFFNETATTAIFTSVHTLSLHYARPICSGRNYTVETVARLLAEAMGRPDLQPQMLGKARSSDIRHCIPDITRARERLGYEPRHFLEDSLHELVERGPGQRARDRVVHRSEEHTSELQSLMRISYAVFCLPIKTQNHKQNNTAN